MVSDLLVDIIRCQSSASPVEFCGRLLPFHVKPMERDGMNYCPRCGKFFEPAHAARKPRFCEDCGARLEWREEHDD